MVITRKIVYEIAETFLDEANSGRWDGKGDCVTDFDTCIRMYEIGSEYEVLNIHFERIDGEWLHVCELIDIKTGECSAILSGYGIDSVENLTDTILDLIKTELGESYE